MAGQKKSEHPLTEFLPYILFVVGLGVILISMPKKQISSPTNGIESSDQSSVRRNNQERVNRYLKDAYNKKQIEEVRAKNELGRTNPAADIPRQGVVQKAPTVEYSGADIQPEDRWSQGNETTMPMTPEEVVQYQLKRRQDEANRTEQERQAFIDEFIENARRNGFEVQVDQNLKVRSVKKIRQ